MEELPSFLYRDGMNNIRIGCHGDTDVTDEWNEYLKKLND